MGVDARMRWGLAGLVAFEAILAGYTFLTGSPDYAGLAAAAGAILVYGLWVAARGEQPSPWVWGAAAAVTLARAYWQTRTGQFPLGVLPTYLVPLGFGLLAFAVRGARPRVGLAGLLLIGAARTWFIGWYLLGGSVVLAFANLVAAAAVWVWASSGGVPAEGRKAIPASRTAL